MHKVHAKNYFSINSTFSSNAYSQPWPKLSKTESLKGVRIKKDLCTLEDPVHRGLKNGKMNFIILKVEPLEK